VVRFLSPELTVVLLPFAFLDAMNPGRAGAYWFESSLVHRAQTLRGQDDKALQGRRVEVCEVSAYPGDLDDAHPKVGRSRPTPTDIQPSRLSTTGAAGAEAMRSGPNPESRLPAVLPTAPLPAPHS
jgi:hypothetical protein